MYTSIGVLGSVDQCVDAEGRPFVKFLAGTRTNRFAVDLTVHTPDGLEVACRQFFDWFIGLYEGELARMRALYGDEGRCEAAEV